MQLWELDLTDKFCGSPAKFIRLVALSAILLLMAITADAAHPYRAEVRLDYAKLESLLPGERIVLVAQHPTWGAIDITLVCQVALDTGKENSAQWVSAALFQGQWQARRRGHEFHRFMPVSADLISGQLRLRFAGRPVSGRRQRFFTILVDGRSAPAGTSSHVGKLLYAPTRLPWSCEAVKQDSGYLLGPYNVLAGTSSRRSKTGYVEVSLAADYKFYRHHGRRTKAELLSILNGIEAIFAPQLGLRFELVNLKVYQKPIPNLDTNDAISLLPQFRSYTLATNNLGKADAYHLFTGNNLLNDIIGISYVGQLCSAQEYNFGLTQLLPVSIQVLTAAHEFGHLLGATHPEESLPSPASSLMTGVVAPGQNQFSEFSRQEIDDYLSREGDCIDAEILASPTLVVSGTSTGRYTKLQVDAAGLAVDDCELVIYGGTRAAQVSKRRILELMHRNRLAASYSYSKYNTIKGNIRIGRGPSTQQVFLRSALLCSDHKRVRFSQIVTKQLPVRSGITGRKILQRLANRFNPLY